MARRTTTLTDTEVKSAKHKEKDFKLFDGRGLYLLVTKGGGKHWKLKYRMLGKEKKISLGAYPEISLLEARELREKHKSEIAKQIDPNEQKKQIRQESKKEKAKKENTFYTVSQKWHKSYKSEVSEDYHTRLGRALKNYTYKTYTLEKNSKLCIKDKPIYDVTRLDIIAILEALKSKGLAETARRTAMLLNKVYKYAVTHEYTSHNIIADIDLPIILGKKIKKHYPTFKDTKDIKGLLNNIDEYSGDYSTKMALKVLPYVFVRSFNIRHMEWDEINLKTKEWIIPAHKMKTKIEFTMPLPHQVTDILKELKVNALSTVYVFPSSIYKDRPLSDNTLISALRRMGYSKDEFVPHGFRAMFSTIAHEKANEENGHTYTGEVIEALLAHKEPNKVKEAYNRSSYKEAMRGLSSWYANYLEGVKNGDK